MSTAQAAIADRYGTARARPARPRRRRLLLSGAIGGILLMVLIAAWYAFAPATSPTKPTTVSYEVIDSALTTAHISVVPDAQRSIECAVRATSEHEAVVGFREVEIAPDPAADDARPVHLRVDIATTQLAASGHVDSCWFVG